MPFQRKTNAVLGFVAGMLAAVCRRKDRKPVPEDLRRMELGTSTQRLGVRFTERIRDVFRFKWVTRRNAR